LTVAPTAKATPHLLVSYFNPHWFSLLTKPIHLKGRLIVQAAFNVTENRTLPQAVPACSQTNDR
jgi:hypothetical protein